jgi:hypothetical protein
MSNTLDLAQAHDVLAAWRGRTVSVQVRGTGSDLGAVLAILHGTLSERRGQGEWAAYAVGDPSGKVAITLHEPSFERAEKEWDDYVALYFDGGSVTVALDDTAADHPGRSDA